MTKFKWWWSWNSGKLEEYLEQMAGQGYTLDSAGFGLMKFKFEKSEPRRIRYCLDYRSKITEEYRNILEDDGWKLKGCSTGWHLWSREYKSRRPQLFTDRESMIALNNRLLRFVLLILALQVPAVLLNLDTVTNRTDGFSGPLSMFLIVLYALILVMLVYAFFRILIRNRRIRSGSPD